LKFYEKVIESLTSEVIAMDVLETKTLEKKKKSRRRETWTLPIPTSSASPVDYDSESTIKMLRQTFSDGTIVRYSCITRVYIAFIGQQGIMKENYST